MSPLQPNIIQRGGSGSFGQSKPEMQAGKPPPKGSERQNATGQRTRTTNERAGWVQQQIRFGSGSDWAVSRNSVCPEIGQRILEGALETSQNDYFYCKPLKFVFGHRSETTPRTLRTRIAFIR
jgi:hypothetical protein